MNKIIDFMLSKYNLSDFKTRRKAMLLQLFSSFLLLINIIAFTIDNIVLGSETIKGTFQILIIVFLLFTLLMAFHRYLTFSVNTFIIFILLLFVYFHIQELYFMMLFLLPFFLLMSLVTKTSIYQPIFLSVVIIGNIIYMLFAPNLSSLQNIEFYFLISYVIIFGVIQFYVVNKIESEVEQSQNVIKQSTVDFVLKANNRRSIDRKNQAMNLEDKIAILMIGINDINQVTEKLDDMQTDKLLKEVMNTIRNTVRVDDYIIRWGQSEFLVILHYTLLSNSGIVGEKIRRAVEFSKYTDLQKKLTVTICATAKNEETGIQEAIDRAADALSEIKLLKKNSVIFP